MRRYFIGGTPQLEDIAYAGKPAAATEGFEGSKGQKILSRWQIEKTLCSVNSYFPF
jgi:hypothetical protein